MSQTIITIISDWGNSDHYTGAFKGRVLRADPGATVVDISHNIRRFDIQHAAMVLKNSFHEFPEGSIHVVSILDEASVQSPHIAMRFKNHYFVGPDNGVFFLAFEQQPDEVVEITLFQESHYFSFPALDVFAQAASKLGGGAALSEIGDPAGEIRPVMLPRPSLEKNAIRGRVISIDSYGNAITNINEEEFLKIGKKRVFNIRFSHYNCDEIVKAYSDVPAGEPCALFGTTGLLEIALCQNSAHQLLGLRLNDAVTVEFENE